MQTLTIYSVIPYDAGAQYLHSAHGALTVIDCKEHKLMGFSLLCTRNKNL